jgi:hypothetical protein
MAATRECRGIGVLTAAKMNGHVCLPPSTQIAGHSASSQHRGEVSIENGEGDHKMKRVEF